MEVNNGGRPQYFSRYGFENAPLTKLVIFASGAATANLFFISTKYSSVFQLHWPSVIAKRQIWRLITSQFVYDSTAELLYGLALLYHTRVLERQWGTRKFASFILATYSLTIGSHLVACSFDFTKNILPVSNTMASGLYGPLFASLIFYAKDVYSSSLMSHNGFSITNKWLTYFIALRMMTVNKKSYIAAILGLLSGVAFGANFLYIADWFCVPRFVSNFVQTIYNWFQIDENKPKHRKTLCGATEEIQDDMIYDYVTRSQLSASRMQMGQGYADTLQPGRSTMHGLLDEIRLQNGRNIGQRHEPILNQSQISQNREYASNQTMNETSEEEKIQRLVEMGFTRDAVIAALENSGNDIQTAMNALLTQ